MDRRNPPTGIDVFKFRGDEVRPILLEMDIAEHNFNFILDTARNMISKSLLFHDVANVDVIARPLFTLVSELKLVFAFIRRDMKLAFRNIDLGSRQVANSRDQKPVISPNNFKEQQTVCPLTLLFRIIAQGLSVYRVRVGDNTWGPIRPLHDLLVNLQGNLRTLNVEGISVFWPGLATCIMFHEYDSTFTIASSTARYHHLAGLTSLARTVRKDHMTRLRARIPPRDKNNMTNVERFCKEVSKDRARNPFAQPSSRAQVDGVGATFNPDGQYTVACFLDFWRFDMQRPTAARVEEASYRMADRQLYGVDSCAEWELWMIKISKLKIKPGVVLRKHPLIEMRQTFPPYTQSSRPPNWVPPPRESIPNMPPRKSRNGRSDSCDIM